MEWLPDNIMMGIIAGAAAVGATLMKFGGALWPVSRSSTSRCFKEAMLEELGEIRRLMERMVAESIEMHEAMTANTKVMDNIRQDLGNLRVETAKLDGRIR